MKHKLGNMQCLVAHFDGNGDPQPACRQCSLCYQWIAHGKVNDECPGHKATGPLIFSFSADPAALCSTPTGRKQEVMENQAEVVEQEPKLQQVREKVTAIRSMQHGTERENAFRALHEDLDRIEKELTAPASSPDPDTIMIQHGKFSQSGEPITNTINLQAMNGTALVLHVKDGDIELAFSDPDDTTLALGKFWKGGERVNGDIEIVDPEGDMMLFGIVQGVLTDGPRYSQERQNLTMTPVPTAEQVAAKEAARVADLNKNTTDRAIAEAQQGPNMIGAASTGGAELRKAPSTAAPIPISGNIAHATSEGDTPPIKVPDGIYTGNSIEQANPEQATKQVDVPKTDQAR